MTDPEAAGSSPALAITDHSEMSGFLFLTGVNKVRLGVIQITNLSKYSK